jgi:cholest-4-en-3-one 26-monooxygenase
MPVLDVDLTDRELYRQGFPHEVFTDLRARGAVLHHPKTPLDRTPEGVEFWVVTRYAEVQQASRDAQRFSSLDGPTLSPALDVQKGQAVVYADAPIHTRLRKLIAAGFTPRMIARLDEQVRRRTDAILDDVVARDGTVDFVRDVAYQLPMHIIGDIVGIPEADRPFVFGITDTFMRAGDPTTGVTEADREAKVLQLYEYATALGAEKRAHPADDVWSVLASAEIEDDTGERVRLTDFQLDLFFLVLSVAGSETTRNAISHGLLALIEHPDCLADLRADPSLWDTATDEIVRWSSPVADFARTATVDTVLGGVDIAAGDRVVLFYPSANRDERAFTEPFRFDIRRSPNHHVSFGGGGAHYCLGAHLARREIRTLLEQVLARFDDITLTGDVAWMVGGPDQSVAVSLDRMPVHLASR